MTAKQHSGPKSLILQPCRILTRHRHFVDPPQPRSVRNAGRLRVGHLLYAMAVAPVVKSPIRIYEDDV